jgi:hypothetical protein
MRHVEKYSTAGQVTYEHTAHAHCMLDNRLQTHSGRSQWPRGLRRRSSAARLLRLWLRIPPGAWMFVCCACCVCQVEVSATSWSLVQRSPTECGASLCVIYKPRKTRRLKPATRLWKIQPQWVVTPGKQKTDTQNMKYSTNCFFRATVVAWTPFNITFICTLPLLQRRRPVYCAVRAESFNINQVILSLL